MHRKYSFPVTISLILFLSFLNSLNAQELKKSEHVFLGYPSVNCQILYRAGYVVCYDKNTKVADWTSYHLKSDYIVKKVKRKEDFRPDPDLKEGERAELADYRSSGFDRGHLVPASDMSRSEKLMSESFLLSNMAPQVGPEFNRGIWKDLEADVRKWAKKRKDIYVLTGPLYLDKNGNKTSRFEAIGQDRVAIPTHFYKIVLATFKAQKEIEAIAFILPNKRIPSNKLPVFITTVDEIERLSGLDFFSELDSDLEKRLESTKAAHLW